jgi:hypothetical protein
LLRRRFLTGSLGLPLLTAVSGCARPLPEMTAHSTSDAAHALLFGSATAHGVHVFAGLNDINVSYAGHWHSLIAKIQPVLVDPGFRGGSQERILNGAEHVGQAHQGPRGGKQVARLAGSGDRGDVRVWFNGLEATDAEQRAAAALVVDGYSLFLLGPALLAHSWLTQRSAVLEAAGSSPVIQDGRSTLCDVLSVSIKPGLGFSDGDQLALYIDRETRLMRRVRFTLNGLESTQGAIAEVDTLDPIERDGMIWPTRFHEQLRRPFSLAVHDWRLTGLDVDRGVPASAVSGATFTGEATRPARPLT